MNYRVVVPQKKFDIGVVRWLIANISEQNVLWKAEPDMWERRLVFFVNEADSINFKEYFKL